MGNYFSGEMEEPKYKKEKIKLVDKKKSPTRKGKTSPTRKSKKTSPTRKSKK